MVTVVVAKAEDMQKTIDRIFMFVSEKTLLVSSWSIVNKTRRKVPLERPERSAKPELNRERHRNIWSFEKIQQAQLCLSYAISPEAKMLKCSVLNKTGTWHLPLRPCVKLSADPATLFSLQVTPFH